MKAPRELTGADVIGANIAVRGWVSLGGAKPENEQVVVEHAGCGQRDRVLRVVRAQVFAEVEPAILTKGFDRLARSRIEGIEEVHDVSE